MRTKHLRYLILILAAVIIPATTKAQDTLPIVYIQAKHSGKCAQVNGGACQVCRREAEEG